MKTKLFLTLALASSLPLFADRDLLVPVAPAVEEAGAEKKGEGFLGVSVDELDEALAKQLDLKHGVTLRTVSPGSAAEKAGLEVNDIITEVDGKAIDSMESLREAISARKAGEETKLGLVQKGKRVEKKVELGERPPIPEMPAIRILPGAGGALRAGGFFEMGLGVGGGGRGGKVRMGDGLGSVEMSGQGEGCEVTVRGRNDEIQFEGPWYTPQDKAGAPPEIRRRIDRVTRMGIGGLGGLGGPRIEFDMIPELRVLPGVLPDFVPPPPPPAPGPAPAPPKAK